MGTLLDLASLVTIPSGYKVGTVYSVVPTDGAGDLSFTRSNDTATRVGPNGLIEKVRTNLILESQALATTWSVFAPSGGGTIVRTNNYATAPDGTMTATRIVNTGSSANQWVYQDFSPKPSTFSVYAKRTGATNQTFRLFGNNGAVATGNLTATDTWQRFSFTIVADTAKPMGIAADISGNTYDILFWGAQFEDTDFGATDYIPTTTTAVSVGPVANLPRLDYLNSTCPNLLLEPQRTNVLTYSEQLNNAVWTTLDNVSVSANVTTTLDPSGYYGADKLVENTANDQHRIYRSASGSGATFSFFAKAAGRSWIAVLSNNGSFTYFDIENGTIGTIAATSTATITNYGNGWYRCSVYNTHPSFGSLIQLSTGNNVTSYQGNGTSGAFIWGCQLEESATYATSYVPTLGAASTRGADSCSKTGISSLIGQTQGTLFCDFNWEQKSGVFYVNSISDGTISNDISISFGNTADNRLRFFIISGGSDSVFFDSATLASGRYKVAFAYANNDAVAYINGVQQFTDSSVVVPATSAFKFLRANDTLGFNGNINEQLLFPTRLSNAELAQLTTL